MTRTFIACAAAFAALTLASGAGAQARGVHGNAYAIASAGASWWDGRGTDRLCDINAECDKLDTASRLVLGYRYTPGMALELGFWDFGRFTARTGGVRADATATAVGLGVAILGDMPPNWSGTVRLGLASVRGTADDTFGFSSSQSTPQVYVGFGLGVLVMPRLWLETSWDLSQVRLDDADIKDTVHAITLGAKLVF